jgi:hypothetical protein
MKHFRINAELQLVKAGGIYSYHWALTCAVLRYKCYNFTQRRQGLFVTDTVCRRLEGVCACRIMCAIVGVCRRSLSNCSIVPASTMLVK